MLVKILGVCMVAVGLFALVFAGMAYFELSNLATSQTVVPMESLRLVKIVGPEFFDPGNTEIRPHELVAIAVNRIYAIGFGGIVLLVVGGLLLMVGQTRRRDPSGAAQ